MSDLHEGDNRSVPLNPRINLALSLEEVTKSYHGTPPVHALNKVSLSVEHGEFLGIVGASGSGKSTLLHVIGTLSRPTTGSVYINGWPTECL